MVNLRWTIQPKYLVPTLSQQMARESKSLVLGRLWCGPPSLSEYCHPLSLQFTVMESGDRQKAARFESQCWQCYQLFWNISVRTIGKLVRMMYVKLHQIRLSGPVEQFGSIWDLSTRCFYWILWNSLITFCRLDRE